MNYANSKEDYFGKKQLPLELRLLQRNDIDQDALKKLLNQTDVKEEKNQKNNKNVDKNFQKKKENKKSSIYDNLRIIKDFEQIIQKSDSKKFQENDKIDLDSVLKSGED